MGKAELENIRRLHKIRSYQKGKVVSLTIFIIGFLFIELRWLIQFLPMYITGKKYGAVVWNDSVSDILPLVAVIFTGIYTFRKETYKGNVSVFPHNNVTLYVSQWIVTLEYGVFLALMTSVFSGAGYGVAYIISKMTGKLELVNVISLRYFIMMGIYMVTVFVLLDAVIKLAGVVFRKSRLVAGIIIAVVMIWGYFRKSFAIVNFFIRENNFALFEIKAVVAAAICFGLGYILEKKIKNSKNEMVEKKISALGMALGFVLIYVALMGIIFVSVGMGHSEGWEITRTNTKKEYTLEVPKEKVKYKLYTDDAGDLFYKGIEKLKLKKGKTSRLVVKKHEIDNQGSQIKDVFKDLDFEVLFRAGKIYIEHKTFDGMYLYLSVPGVSNRQIQSFMGDEMIHCDFDDELIDNYLSKYELTIYLPEEYLEEEITLEY